MVSFPEKLELDKKLHLPLRLDSRVEIAMVEVERMTQMETLLGRAHMECGKERKELQLRHPATISR
jgi:hypothetical protein